MRYEVTTGLTLPKALEQAAAYFGPGGVGLQAITQTPHSLVFQGSGGHPVRRPSGMQATAHSSAMFSAPR